MLVFAFDRDWTVDVNPHPHHEAVPLEWVHHLAHETDHAVYAIGNQDLTDEAAVPGIVDIVGRHPDEWDEWLGAKTPSGRYEKFPRRRERLQLIADLHPNAEGYVVVDDLDLSDVDGWEHYHAWEFVPAIERGDIDPALPWAADPMPDGGMPALAGPISFPDGAVREFLEDHADATAYEITYDDDGTTRTAIFWDVSVRERSFDRPAARSVVECTTLAPGSEPETIAVADLKEVVLADPPAEAYTAGAETAAERVRGLGRLAAVDPGAVSVATLLVEIEGGDDAVKAAGAVALRTVASERPAACTQALPLLRTFLEQESFGERAAVLRTLRAVADESPADVAPLLDAVAPSLESDRRDVRYRATRIVAAVAEGDPTDVAALVPQLAGVVEDRARGHSHALYALSSLSGETIEPLRAVTDTLADFLADEDPSDTAKLNAITALGRVVGEHPSVGVEVVDDVATSLDADNTKLRANSAAFVSDVSSRNTLVVQPHLDALVALLTDEDDFCRINASAAVSRLAEDVPEDVAPHVDILVGLLEDDDAIVRKNACWGLGYLGERAEEAVDALERTRVDDDDGDVRDRAAWAFHQITEASDLEA